MAEETKERDIGAAAAGPGADPAAMAIGLSGASRVKADAFLDKQNSLADLQIENLRKLDDYETSHLRWRRFNDQMKGAMQIMLGAIGALIVVAITAAVWSATNDRGLVVEGFTVPPDLAAQGETGAVVATHVMDRISAMDSHTSSFRARSSYQNNWGNDIKVQIPDTGISVTEAYRFLVGWLGDQTHISGEVVRTAKGYAVTARVGGAGGATFEGPDLDPLLDRAAEHIMDSTQPYLYAVWLATASRAQEGYRRMLSLAESDALASERAWAYGGLTTMVPDGSQAIRYGHDAIRLKPDLELAWSNISGRERLLGYDEAALKDREVAVRLLNGRAAADVSAPLLVLFRLTSEADLDTWHGDYRGAASLDYQALDAVDRTYRRSQVLTALSANLARDHDLRAAREVARAEEGFSVPSGGIVGSKEGIESQRVMTATAIAFDLEDWRGVERTVSGLAKDASNRRDFIIQPDANLAYAHARWGDMAGADALIGRSPPDCNLCLRMRGRIRAVEKKWDAAAYWFARARAQAPSIPFAETDWGAMLMRKGDLDAAMAKFKLSNEKGPHFSDPLEMWGEALMAQNRSDLALAKFEEADKCAPNWGRLHLKWGEALWWSGNRDEAKKQFAVASSFDLTPWEKSELAKVSHG